MFIGLTDGGVAALVPLVLRGMSAKLTGGVCFEIRILPQSKIKDFCQLPHNEGAKALRAFFAEVNSNLQEFLMLWGIIFIFQ